MDILNNRIKVLPVADKPVPIFPHPEARPGNAEPQLGILLHRPSPGIRFPRLHNFPESRLRIHENMHMVRHDAPRQQPVSFPVKMQQRLLNNARYRRMPQRAAAHAGVQPLLNVNTSGESSRERRKPRERRAPARLLCFFPCRAGARRSRSFFLCSCFFAHPMNKPADQRVTMKSLRRRSQMI